MIHIKNSKLFTMKPSISDNLFERSRIPEDQINTFK